MISSSVPSFLRRSLFQSARRGTVRSVRTIRWGNQYGAYTAAPLSTIASPPSSHSTYNDYIYSYYHHHNRNKSGVFRRSHRQSRGSSSGRNIFGRAAAMTAAAVFGLTSGAHSSCLCEEEEEGEWEVIFIYILLSLFLFLVLLFCSVSCFPQCLVSSIVHNRLSFHLSVSLPLLSPPTPRSTNHREEWTGQ